jgi:regulatory protein YycI of two-component signal transduction system YycFG
MLFSIVTFLLISSEVIFEIPWYFILIFFVCSIVIAVFYLQNKQNKICVILDTKLLQEKFLNENGVNPLKNKKFSKKYRILLLKNAKENDIKILSKSSFIFTLQEFCLLCYFSILPILIFFMFSTIYLSSTQTIVIILLLIIGLFFFLVMAEKRSIGQIYKYIDSEIKQILFEEETGYKPIDKGKFTFKYKAWLMFNERKMGN